MMRSKSGKVKKIPRVEQPKLVPQEFPADEVLYFVGGSQDGSRFPFEGPVCIGHQTAAFGNYPGRPGHYLVEVYERLDARPRLYLNGKYHAWDDPNHHAGAERIEHRGDAGGRA